MEKLFSGLISVLLLSTLTGAPSKSNAESFVCTESPVSSPAFCVNQALMMYKNTCPSGFMIAEFYENKNFFQITEYYLEEPGSEKTYSINLSVFTGDLSNEIKAALVSLGWRFWNRSVDDRFDTLIYLLVPESEITSLRTNSSIHTAATLLDFIGSEKKSFNVEDCS